MLLPKLGQDWRWRADHPDSPWYPSLALFRRATAGDWSDIADLAVQVLAEVRQAKRG